MSKENIKNCVESILEKDISNAKLILADKFSNYSNEKTIGIKFALEGIISKHSGRNSMNNESLEYLKEYKIKRVIVILDRCEGGVERLKLHGIEVVSLFTIYDIV